MYVVCSKRKLSYLTFCRANVQDILNKVFFISKSFLFFYEMKIVCRKIIFYKLISKLAKFVFFQLKKYKNIILNILLMYKCLFYRYLKSKCYFIQIPKHFNLVFRLIYFLSKNRYFYI